MATIAGAAVVVITWLTVGRGVEALVRRFREVGSGNLSARVPVQGKDELARLAEEFNVMCARLEEAQRTLLAAQEERRLMEAALRDSERMASLGRIAAVLAHQIGTPLSVIQGRAERLHRRLSAEERAELHIIGNQIDRISQSVRAVLDFSRVQEPQLALVDVPVILSRVMKLLEHRFEAQGVAVVSKVDPSLPTLLADADQLHEVFLNLAVNALDAMPHGGTLEIEARHRTAEHNGSQRPVVEVSLQDSGSGVRQEDLTNVFKPFFTTKQLGKGTGLGLFICRNIVEEHGGWIELTSEPDRGARVTVCIPAVPVTMALHSS
jgi:two-component system, NtrC family, sensor kinase